MLGGAGNDALAGGSGNDDLQGDGGNNTLDGGDGADTALGGEGDDTLTLHAGDDQADGGAGTDIVDGGEGNDLLLGSSGNDALSGGAGGDTLNGGRGDDALDGGLGDDIYVYNLIDGGKDSITDAGGDDILILTGGVTHTAISLELGSLKLNLGGGNEIHIMDFDPQNARNSSGIEHFTFEATGLTFTAQQLVDTLGFTLSGTPDADVLAGTNLGDRINALAGDDVVLGNAGDDIIDLGTGDDAADGGAGGDSILGGDGADIIFGGEGNDTLLGGAGDDTLYGEAGNDLLHGGAGMDAMAGGAGDDTYRVDNTADQVLELAGEGIDTVEAAFNYTLGANLENLTLEGADNLTGIGNALDNTLTGNAGNNLLQGLDGNDILLGGDGDTLSEGSPYAPGLADPGVIDRIVFGAGIARADVTLKRQTDGSLLVHHGVGDEIHGRAFRPGRRCEARLGQRRRARFTMRGNFAWTFMTTA